MKFILFSYKEISDGIMLYIYTYTQYNTYIYTMCMYIHKIKSELHENLKMKESELVFIILTKNEFLNVYNK